MCILLCHPKKPEKRQPRSPGPPMARGKRPRAEPGLQDAQGPGPGRGHTDGCLCPGAFRRAKIPRRKRTGHVALQAHRQCLPHETPGRAQARRARRRKLGHYRRKRPGNKRRRAGNRRGAFDLGSEPAARRNAGHALAQGRRGARHQGFNGDLPHAQRHRQGKAQQGEALCKGLLDKETEKCVISSTFPKWSGFPPGPIPGTGSAQGLPWPKKPRSSASGCFQPSPWQPASRWWVLAFCFPPWIPSKQARFPYGRSPTRILPPGMESWAKAKATNWKP